MMMSDGQGNWLTALAAACTYQLVEPGALLFEEGQFCRGVHILLSAKVRLVTNSVAGALEIQPDVGSGTVLGIGDLLAKRPYPVSAAIVERGEVGFVPADAFAFLTGPRLEALANALRGNVEGRVQLTTLIIQAISAVFEMDESKAKHGIASD
jgi:CRP-like cAMP-binding protein